MNAFLVWQEGGRSVQWMEVKHRKEIEVRLFNEKSVHIIKLKAANRGLGWKAWAGIAGSVFCSVSAVQKKKQEEIFSLHLTAFYYNFSKAMLNKSLI